MAPLLQHSLVACTAVLLTACGGGAGGDGPTPPAGGPGTNPPPPPPTNSFPRARPVETFLYPDLIVNHPIDFDVAQNFFDDDGDPLSFTIEISRGDVWRGLSISGTHLIGTPLESNANPQAGLIIDVSDGRGGELHWEMAITIVPNAAPVVARPNPDRIMDVGSSVDVDVTQGGGGFDDPDGDSLTYTITLTPLPRGLRAEGTRVLGALESHGAVFVHVRADDSFGGSVEDVFAVAAPAVETRRPTLPSTSYVYDDLQLTLPAIARQSRAHFSPLWDTTVDSGNPTTNAGATLGRVLFYDKRLSITNMGSCGSCHHQEHGFAAPEAFSAGPQGELTKRNVMGLTAVRYNLDNLYFGDLRVTGLERLVTLPIEEPTELGNQMDLLVPKLAATDFYPPLFEAAFGTPDITPDRIAMALAQFLRSLIAFDTTFDRAFHPLADNEEPHPELVLTSQELRGAEIFDAKCSRCHERGAQTLDTSANNGLDLTPSDPGAGGGRFRAASLRNVAVTAPYMHDGRFDTLREVIEHYSSGVVAGPLLDPRMSGMAATEPVNLTQDDKDALEAFLKTFTDQHFLSDPKFSDPF
jgi:cytochrome c peroxidase